MKVSNASGESGLAARTSEELAANGFPIYDTGNYTGTSTQTVVRFAAGMEAEAATVASSFPGTVLQRASDSSLGNVVEVVLGADFDGTVAFPTPAGTASSRLRSKKPSTRGPHSCRRTSPSPMPAPICAAESAERRGDVHLRFTC